MDAFERAANESAVFALMRAGNYQGAEARLRTMLGHNANDARALALLADCHLNRKDWKSYAWRALGVGIYRGFAVMWVGAEDDPTR